MKRPLLSGSDGLRSEAQELAACVQFLECQVAVHSTELASGRSDITKLQESVIVAQHQLADTQSALLNVELEVSATSTTIVLELIAAA